MKYALFIAAFIATGASAQIITAPNGILYCNGAPCQVSIAPQIPNTPPAPVNYSAMQTQPDPVGNFQRAQLMRAQIEETRARTAAIEEETQRQRATFEPNDTRDALARARAAAILAKYGQSK